MSAGRTARRWTSGRIHGWTCAVAAALGVVTAIAFWGHGGRYDLSIILLALTVLLFPSCWLVRRDIRLRERRNADRLTRPQPDRRQSVPAPQSTDGSGRILVSRPTGYYQNSMRSYRMVLDRNPVGSLRNGETCR